MTKETLTAPLIEPPVLTKEMALKLLDDDRPDDGDLYLEEAAALRAISEGRTVVVPAQDAADARRYRWLKKYLLVAADGPSDWTCWLELTTIPFRMDPNICDAEKLLDALIERFPAALAATQETP